MQTATIAWSHQALEQTSKAAVGNSVARIRWSYPRLLSSMTVGKTIRTPRLSQCSIRWPWIIHREVLCLMKESHLLCYEHNLGRRQIKANWSTTKTQWISFNPRQPEIWHLRGSRTTSAQCWLTTSLRKTTTIVLTSYQTVITLLQPAASSEVSTFATNTVESWAFQRSYSLKAKVSKDAKVRHQSWCMLSSMARIRAINCIWTHQKSK